MKDVMVDIETLSTRPDAAIISVGMRQFDRDTWQLGESFYQRCNPEEGYHIDLNTVKWWLGQGSEARAEFQDVKTPLRDVLPSFVAMLISWKPDRIWALPPSFDQIILENALRRNSMGYPWKYDQWRDVRTVCDLAKLAKEDRVKAAVEHNALADCDAQIETLKKALGYIGKI